jgi:hypothetical protein
MSLSPNPQLAYAPRDVISQDIEQNAEADVTSGAAHEERGL